MKKPLDLTQKLALAVIDPLVAQTRAWQDAEEGVDRLERGVSSTNENIKESKDEIITSLTSQVDELNETLKKKLDEELFYEVDEGKIVDSVLAKVKIPKPIPGKDADEGAIIEKMVPLVLAKIPAAEPFDIEGVAKMAVSLIPKSKPSSVKKIDEEKIVASVLGKLPKLEPFKFELTQQDLLNRINKFDHEVDWKVLKNVPYDVLHGGKSSGKIGRGGATRFTQLVDAPTSYTGQGLKAVRVNAGATALEFFTPSAFVSPLTTKGDIFGFDTADARVPVGSNNQVLTADSTQTLGVKWATPTPTTPGGSDTQVQFNDAGAFGGDAGLTYNKTTNALTVGDVLVDDEVYGAGWNASLEVPTKNALYDKIESLVTGVSSVTAANTTLTISPTTGAVLAELNLANANTWTGQQTFSTLSPIVSTLTATRVLYAGASKEIKDDATFTYNDSTNTLSVSRGSFTPLISDAYVDTAAVDPVLNGSPFVAGLTDWTFTSGWAYSATNGGSAKHTSGNTNVLSQTITISAGAYRLQYSLGSTGTSSTFKCRVDGVELGSSATSGTKTVYFSTFSGNILLEFAPGSTQTRDLYDVIIFPIVASDPAIQFKDQSAVTTVEMRAFSRDTLGIGNNTNANNLTGDFDIAIGNQALRYNVVGDYNVAIGFNALQKCNSNFNTGIGASSLEALTTGSQNFGCGYRSGVVLTTGSFNTLLGVSAGAGLTTASYNTLVGYNGASGATTGQYNTLLGGQSAQSLTTGSNNIFIGYAVSNAISTQSYCIAIGSGAASIFTLADYSMAIGNFISGINGSAAISTALGFGATSVATNRITAQAVGSPITGTTTVSGSTAIAGTSTLFLTELAVGNSVAVYNINDGTYYYTTIATITNNTTLTLTGSGGSDSSVTIYKAGTIFNGYNLAGTSVMNIDELGRISTGLGTTASSARLQSQSTTEQLRLNYDASNYFSTTVGSTGGVTFNAVGSGSAFTFSDSIALPYNPQTANYTITTNDHLVNCTANTFTVTLPTAVGITGRIYKIKNSGTGIITVATTSSQTIDGITTQTLNQYDSIEVMSDAANWIIT